MPYTDEHLSIAVDVIAFEDACFDAECFNDEQQRKGALLLQALSEALGEAAEEITRNAVLDYLFKKYNIE